jgi:hypothetical protein
MDQQTVDAGQLILWIAETDILSANLEMDKNTMPI